jgi:glucose-6-phosphate dehydrogenase assembly protein OpcA
MPVNYKILGQSNPAANTTTTAYTVPANTQTVVSTIAVANLSGNSSSFSIAARQAGATLANSMYLAYNTSIPPNDTINYTIGATLGNTDVVSVSSNTGAVTFTLFGSELS